MEASIRSVIAIKLYAKDLQILRRLADQVAAVIEQLQGAANVGAERVAGRSLPFPLILVRPKQEAGDHFHVRKCKHRTWDGSGASVTLRCR
jgi:Cu/Ag efflux pump CusA